MISMSSCISVMGGLDMVNMELTCQNLIRLTMHVIRRAASRTWGSLTQFFRAFHVDIEQHDLCIMALINRSESLYWELMPLQGNEHWRSYLKTACDIGLLVMLFI
jgi:hypothetical protein